MMNLTNEVFNSINKYFSTLRHIGYKPYSDVEKLIVFTFLEELLYSPISQYVTSEDYRVIDSAINSLYGTCIIPFPDYKKSFTHTDKDSLNKYKITKDLNLRVTNDNLLRINF